MTKLYELLAVEPDLRDKANAELKRLSELFKQGTGRFLGQVITYHEVAEGAGDVPNEVTELATTVDGEIGHFSKIFGDYLDVTIQKESTNSETMGEVEVEGLAFAMPATALLNLENRLSDLRKVYARIPTLDPAEKWHFDESQDRYVSDTRVAYKTKKAPRAFVSYEATKEHPAQVETYTEDIDTHRRETVVFSGALTIAEKQKRLERIDALVLAVKQARQRANDTDASTFTLADDLFAYINRE
jgi:hypothetical protein